MATLTDTFTTPNGGTITGEILLIPPTWRDNGTGGTLTRIPARIPITTNTFTQPDLPPGPYIVRWKLHNTTGRPLEDTSTTYGQGTGTQLIYLEDTPTPQRLRTLLAMDVVTESPTEVLQGLVDDWLTETGADFVSQSAGLDADLSANGQRITDLSAPSSTGDAVTKGYADANYVRPRASTIVAIGDSQIAQGLGPSTTSPAYVTHSALNYGLSYLGHPFSLVANLAVGGQTSAQVLASVDAALALDPSILYFSGGGSNDRDVYTVAQSIANLEAIATAAAAQGVPVVYQSVMPVDSPDSTSLARQAQVNGWARRKSLVTPGFFFADCYAQCVDHTTGALIADYSDTTATDTVHLSPRGKAVAGLAVAQALRPLVTGRAMLAPTQGDPANLVTYSHFYPPNSSNEALGPGYWSGVSTITALSGAAWSKVTRPNRSTKWQQLVLPNGAGTRSIKLNIIAGPTTFQAGDVVFANLEYQVDSASEDVTPSGFGIRVLHSPDGVTTSEVGGAIPPNSISGQKGPIHARAGVLQTPPMTVPAGADGTALLQMSIDMAGGGTYRFDSAAVWNITKQPSIFSA